MQPARTPGRTRALPPELERELANQYKDRSIPMKTLQARFKVERKGKEVELTRQAIRRIALRVINEAPAAHNDEGSSDKAQA